MAPRLRAPRGARRGRLPVASYEGALLKIVVRIEQIIIGIAM